MSDLIFNLGRTAGLLRQGLQKKAVGLSWMPGGSAAKGPMGPQQPQTWGQQGPLLPQEFGAAGGKPQPQSAATAAKSPATAQARPSASRPRTARMSPYSRPNPWRAPSQPGGGQPRNTPRQAPQQQTTRRPQSNTGQVGQAGQPQQQVQLSPERVKALQTFAANRRNQQPRSPQGSPWGPAPKQQTQPNPAQSAAKPRPVSQGTAFNSGKTYGSMSPAEKAESMARLRALNGMEAPRSQDPAELGRQAAMTRYDQLAAGHQPEKPVTYDQHSDAAGQFQQNLAAADARLAPVRQAAGEASDARFAAAAQLSPEAQRRVFSNAPKYVPR